MLRILLFLFLPTSLFSQSKTDVNNANLAIDTTGTVSICLGDSVIGRVFLQQYIWSEWVAIDSVEKTRWVDTCYFIKIQLPKVTRDYRISNYRRAAYRFGGHGIDINHSPITINDGYLDTCHLVKSLKVTTKLEFNCDTEYKIYDGYWNIVKKGFGKVIDVSNLAKGSYYLLTPYSSDNFLKL